MKPRIFALLSLLALASSGCTIVKPIACAFVFPIHKIGEDLERADSDEDAHNELPTAAVIVAAPVLIPLKYVYYTLYGAFGGLVTGVVNDLNMVTGNGSLANSRETLLEPLRTNVIDRGR